MLVRTLSSEISYNGCPRFGSFDKWCSGTVTQASTGKIAVLGAGSWGATLCWLLASAGKEVALWSRDSQKVEALKTSHRIDRPLPVTIPKEVSIESDLEECVSGAAIILLCCTAQTMRPVAGLVQKSLKSAVSAGGDRFRSNTQRMPVVVSAAKGIELKTFQRMSQILEDCLQGLPICALSGPNLAAEVLQGLPTASVIACKDEAVARFVQEALSVPNFRVYSNTDIAGVELGGALKNIIAIAAGAVDGLALGANAKAALVTRGLAEMTRVSVALGARASTLAGLSGMGDLVATCYSSLSRNYRLGYHMALGLTAAAAQEELGATAEGVTTAEAVCELSKTLAIELPIAWQVEATLKGLTRPEKAIMSLMTRPLASE